MNKWVAVIISILGTLFLVSMSIGECDEPEPDSPRSVEASKQVCPEDDNGNDFIQCPQAYGDTPFLNRTAGETSREEIIEGQDYSALDRRRLFRPAWTVAPQVKTIPEMLKPLKGD